MGRNDKNVRGAEFTIEFLSRDISVNNSQPLYPSVSGSYVSGNIRPHHKFQIRITLPKRYEYRYDLSATPVVEASLSRTRPHKEKSDLGVMIFLRESSWGDSVVYQFNLVFESAGIQI